MTDTEQNPEDSRRKLVLAAVELVLEHFEQGTGLRDVFAYLTPGAVAERAGVSRGLIYHHWGSVDADGGDAFVGFLTAVSTAFWESINTSILDMGGEMVEAFSSNQSDLIRALSAVELERLSGETASMWRAGSALVLHSAMPRGQDDVVFEQLTELYEVALPAIGREMVPPLRPRNLAVALWCVFDGFSTYGLHSADELRELHPWTPEVQPVDPEPDWTLLAITVESIVLGMTRRIDD